MSLPDRPGRSASRAGFSLVESLAAVTLTTLAGAALLTSLGSAVTTSTATRRAAVAGGLVNQLMDELASVRFPTGTNPTPGGTAREQFDDLDDYSGWSASPPVDRLGRALGTEGYELAGRLYERPAEMRPDAASLNQFRRFVVVERVRSDGGSGWTVVPDATSHRRVTVGVEFVDGAGNRAVVSETTRIFSHVPSAP